MYVNNNLKGVLLGLLGFASYTCMDAFIKYVLGNHSFQWPVLIFYVSLTVLTILFFRILLSKDISFKARRPGWLFFRACIGVSSLHIIFFILPYVDLDLFYSLIFIAPIISSFLATFFLKEHMNIHKFLSIVFGFCGILIITRPWLHFTNHSDAPFNWLELVPLLVAFADAAIGITVRKYLSKDNPVTLVFYQFILCTVVAATCVIFISGHLPLLDLPKAGLVLVTALFAMGGYIFYAKAVQTAPIQIVMPMAYTQMLFGTILSILIFNHYPTIYTIIGSLVIILASAYLSVYVYFAKNVD